ncbi:hypothetical protein NYR62_10510 [Actinobacillus genomosp. 1]|uniref:hypothetical protein n=1 Tax=Actinobacillus genomosp. 1 TaxID=254839 RepID=UPI0024427652|nr:hypothetical protein [Actinobacillus genomosp. 1]WGE36002.1 hypothetical protein NYR62_10510 [Actinobacillus genomosp. 1]
MWKFITSIFYKNEKKQQVSILKDSFKNRLSTLSSKEKWDFSYILFKKIFDVFDFEILREIVDKLLIFHQKEILNQADVDDIHNRINTAKFEDYISLNEAGYIADLLAIKSDFETEDVMQVIRHFMKIGECNFHADELVTWNDNIEICWNIFIQEKTK